MENKQSAPFRRDDPPHHTSLQGITHFSFRVSNLSEVVIEIKEKEIEIVIEDVTIRDINNRVMMIRDPDGNLIQFMEEVQDLNRL